MITTIGQLMLHEALPADVRPAGVVGKSGLSKLLKAIGEKHPARYGELVGHIKDVGNMAAYHSGTSFTLDDLAPHTEMRDAAFKKHGKDLEAIYELGMKRPELRRHPEYLAKKIKVLSAIEEDVNLGMKKVVDEAHSNVTKWVASGAKGDLSMARQMIGMSGLNVDVANRMVPEIARKSFSEGLSPIDFHVHANGARKGVVLTYTAVQAPGAFAKELNTIASDMVVTATDCGTHAGRAMAVDNPDVLDRCLAATHAPGVGHRNDVVTPAVVAAARKKGLTQLAVRTPLACAAREGVCAHCFGVNEMGRLPAVGEHVGMKAAQAITEPLTQLALNNKHAGGVVTAGKSPLEQILQFMHAPKTFAGAAVLARATGKVGAIAKAPAGGWHVEVGGQRHYVAPGLEVTAVAGQQVQRGDALTTGTPHPVEVVEAKGLDRGREYFADGLKNLYGSAGINGHGKIFETIARSIVNLGQVMQPGETGHVAGDVVHWNQVREHMGTTLDTVDVAKAEGRILASDHGGLPTYHILTPKGVAQLQGAGVKSVAVFKHDAFVAKPVLLGTERASLHKGDWMANLAFRFLAPTFKENVATGATTNLHGWNPYSAYAHGAEFGKGPGGRF